MVKIRSMTISIILFLIVYIGKGYSQNLDINDQSAQVNDTINFTISINNVPNAVGAMQFDVSYDTSVLDFTDNFTKGDLVSGFSIFDVSDVSSGQIRVAGYTTSEITSGSSGEVVKLEFMVKSCTNSTLTLTGLEDDLSDWSTGDGQFSCTTASPTPTPTPTPKPSPSPTATATQVETPTPSACNDSYESNDDIDNAYGPLESGTSYVGKICTSGDIDWFKSTITSTGSISLSLAVPSTNDYNIALYNPSFTQISGSTGGSGQSESIGYMATTPGDYYIKIYGYNESYNTTDSYTLTYYFDDSAIPILCEAESISVSLSKMTLKRKKSGDVTVTVTGDDGCAVEGETVTATINAAGKKRISISPTSASTDANGWATFTITAKKKIGAAKVTFKAGSIKKSMTVKVRK